METLAAETRAAILALSFSLLLLLDQTELEKNMKLMMAC